MEKKMEGFERLLHSKIKEKVNPTVYIVWISDIEFRLTNGVLYIKAPNQFKSNIVKNEFSELIKQIISDMLSENIELKFVYQKT